MTRFISSVSPVLLLLSGISAVAAEPVTELAAPTGITDPSEITKDSTMKVLTGREEKIVAVAAYAARGDQTGLKTALTEGLDAGVTVSEYKEILVQVYAYCGFPRSLNALSTFMELLEERKATGISDVAGALPGPLPEGKSLDFGTENQTKLVGREVKGGLYDFAPAIDAFLKSHLFGDIFARDNLDWKTRELATIAMLAAVPGLEPQLQGHIAIGKHNGLTDAQIEAILAVVATQVMGLEQVSSFPLGEENTGYAQYFTGKSYLAPLTQDERLNVPVANVTFEPGCRNNWHTHTGGQLLIAVGGVGYYQERGKPSRRLLPGDVVEIPPDVDHWHGAAPDHWFAHLAIACNPQTSQTTWLEPVSEEDYQSATREN
ncbi:MAG: carboxymuconolactone decarboxylase family protein [Planctomycetia bacterium]|nr:carboxymuconolactone decarboxylase family protein [Planctomycetia bacterium]